MLKSINKTKFKKTEIGLIPKDWDVKQLQTISKVIDSAHQTPRYTTNGFSMVRVTDIKPGFLKLNNTQKVSKEVFEEFTKNHKPRKNDVVFSRVGTYGISSFVNTDEPFCLGQNTVVITSPQSRFIYYALNSKLIKKQIEERVVGSTQKTISLANIRELLIAIPTISKEIEHIEKILFDLDSQISNLQIQNQILEKTIKIIFKSWFIDFEGQTKFIKNEFGQIPEGWEIQQLKNIFEINPKRSLVKGEEAIYVEMANMPTESARIIKFIKRKFSSGTKFKNGDTLLARITPCLENGKTAFVDFLQKDEIGWGSTEYIILRPKEPIPAEFGYFIARDEIFRKHAIANMTGTSGRQRVPESSLMDFKIVVPPLDLILKFAKIAQNTFTKIKRNDQQIHYLDEIKNFLLSKLMSGELRVSK